MVKFEISKGIFVGDGCPTFVIAELGINHQGNVDLAMRMIMEAKQCGADCVKFQKRTVERMLTKEGLNQPYNNANSFGDTYGEHKRKLELSFEEFRILKKCADNIGVLFSASGWDEESVDFLDTLGVPFFKMASADLTNHPLLEHTAKKGKPIIISTGMSDMKMVIEALNIVLNINPRIVVMQCTSSYPAPFEELNLNVIDTYKKTFQHCVIGYSSHCLGIAIPFASVVIGAQVLESHFTLDRTMKGGDHAASLEPDGFKKLVRDIRAFEKSRGSYIKSITPSELGCIKKLRKSIVSAKKIMCGEVVTRDMLTVKGPGTGICPSRITEIVGTIAGTDIEEDTIITEKMLEC